MSDAVRLRSANADDYVAICALLGAVDTLHRGGAPWLFREPETPPRPPGLFEEYWRGETCAAIVAQAGEVVGVALVLLRETPDISIFQRRSYGVLDAIAVDPPWRRRGLGSRLASEATAWAVSRGASWIELNVYDFNQEACDFYESLGFQTVSRKLRRPLEGAGPGSA